MSFPSLKDQQPPLHIKYHIITIVYIILLQYIWGPVVVLYWVHMGSVEVKSRAHECVTILIWSSFKEVTASVMIEGTFLWNSDR